MFTTRSRRPVHAVARVLALALFLTGTNFCLVNLIPGAKGCGMATEIAGTPAKRATSCSACPTSRAASSTSTASSKSAPQPARSTSPCCESYAPVASPDANVSAAKGPSTVLLSLVQAPAAQKAPKSTTRSAKPATSKPPQRAATAPPSGRAPPIL